MVNRRIIFFFALLAIAGHCVFGQTSALRDYVGMISQSFHPDAIAFLEKLRDDLEKRNRHAAARVLDAYIKGDSGTGFVYVAPNGTNYMITNYHVISHAETLSVTFEKQDGEKTKFTGLTIIAADEDMDIALLAFAGGQNPFKEGLRFQTRPVEEGADVYSAGFPGLGTAMIWQLGRGMVSNASVRLPMDDGTDKVLGPFIQHTAQVDPGNSGGPLLVQTQGVPTGFAVVGINTLKALSRQAANYSIPVGRIQSFLDASLKKGEVDERALLDARIESFLEGLKRNKAVYPHIAMYLSNTCVGENAEYAMSEVFSRASRTVQDDILNAFGGSPVEGMRQAVAWYIENQIRSRSVSLNIATESVTANDTGYTVQFNINGKMINTEWVNEYGIWRIHQFGDFASGNKELREKNAKAQAKARAADRALRWDPAIQVSGEYVHILDRGPGFGLDFIIRSKYVGLGMRGCLSQDFFQGVAFLGPYVPIKLGTSAALTPFANVGFGVQIKATETSKENNSEMGFFGSDYDSFIGISAQAGLQFITAKVPGLYLHAGYQFNAYTRIPPISDYPESDKHAFFAGVGYAF